MEEKKEMPLDFWNYGINPIVGYKIEKKDEHGKEVEKKYAKTTQPLKQ